MATISTRRVTAAVCAATLAGTLTVLNAHDALTFESVSGGRSEHGGHDARRRGR